MFSRRGGYRYCQCNRVHSNEGWIHVNQFVSWASKNWQAIDKGLILILHINSVFTIRIFGTAWKFITVITVISLISFICNNIKVEKFEYCWETVKFNSTAMKINFVCFTKVPYILFNMSSCCWIDFKKCGERFWLKITNACRTCHLLEKRSYILAITE